MYYFLNFPLKILSSDYLTKKYTSILLKKKNLHVRILKNEPKEHHLSTVFKFCPYI